MRSFREVPHRVLHILECFQERALVRDEGLLLDRVLDLDLAPRSTPVEDSQGEFPAHVVQAASGPRQGLCFYPEISSVNRT